MGLTIQAKTDTSYLFSSLSNSNTNSSDFGMSSILSDYASIKNGSYGKLLKAYYSETASDSVKSIAEKKTANEDTQTTNTELQSDAASLQSAADKLLATGEDSLFVKKETEVTNEDGTKTVESDYDKDAIYNAVASFADSYNSLIETAADSQNQRVLTTAANMTTATAANRNLLSKVGITIGADNKLTVDKESFMKADMKTVESLFGATDSLAYKLESSASRIENYAKADATKASGLYTQDAVYSATALGSGYNYTGLF